MNKKIIKVGSRASELALIQTRWVIERLKEKFPRLEFEIMEIKTIGDKILDKTLNKIGDKGLFVKEIEAALLQGDIDFAVHSMKDVPTVMDENLQIGAITDREDSRDVLISANGKGLKDLPRGARLGTSSIRRAAQLLYYRPDFVIEPIRGNVATRIRKIEEMSLDGVILAAAGISRMGWQYRITEYLEHHICLPAVGQGALGVQIRKGDPFMADLIKPLNNQEVEAAIKAERSFMRELNGGCHVPIGAHANIVNNRLFMDTIIASPDGKELIRLSSEGLVSENEELGLLMAKESMEKGGEEILKAYRAGD